MKSIESLKYVIWIDKNIDNPENQSYIRYFQNEKSIIFSKFNDVESSIKKLKDIYFNKTFIITSGLFYLDFIKSYKNEFKNLYVFPKIIIFTSDSKRFLNKYSKGLPINDEIFNSGGVVDSFNLILYFLSKNNNFLKISNIPYLENRRNIDIEYLKNNFIFEYIQQKEELIVPLFFYRLINIPTNKEIYNFNLKLFKDYGSHHSINQLIEPLITKNNNLNFPYQIFCKYWLRAYTLETDFYKNMNQDLKKGVYSIYSPFINSCYYSLYSHSLTFYYKNLYRAGLISIEEIQTIQKYLKKKNPNIPSCIMFSRCFLSFSFDYNVAMSFMGKKHNNLYPVLFIVEKGNSIDFNNITNADLSKISFYDENEILFFPFSVFELSYCEYKDQYKFYLIKLNYLGKYKRMFPKDAIALLNEPQPNTLFLTNLQKILLKKIKIKDNVKENNQNEQKKNLPNPKNSINNKNLSQSYNNNIFINSSKNNILNQNDEKIDLYI